MSRAVSRPGLHANVAGVPKRPDTGGSIMSAACSGDVQTSTTSLRTSTRLR
jgi:hypothetical protein